MKNIKLILAAVSLMALCSVPVFGQNQASPFSCSATYQKSAGDKSFTYQMQSIDSLSSIDLNFYIGKFNLSDTVYSLDISLFDDAGNPFHNAQLLISNGNRVGDFYKFLIPGLPYQADSIEVSVYTQSGVRLANKTIN